MNMTQQQSEAGPLRDSAPSERAGRTKQRSPSFWRAVVGGLLVLVIVAAAYYTVSGFFSANGTWYGTLHIPTGGRTVSIETSMDVSTFFTGSLSGKGTFCVPLPLNHTVTFAYSLSGNRAFSLPGQNSQSPITLTAQYTVPLLLGFTLPLGPSLRLHGNVADSRLHLTGGSRNALTSLDMQHGTQTDFLAACKALSPLG
jgi:hypothetical protein